MFTAGSGSAELEYPELTVPPGAGGGADRGAALPVRPDAEPVGIRLGARGAGSAAAPPKLDVAGVDAPPEDVPVPVDPPELEPLEPDVVGPPEAVPGRATAWASSTAGAATPNATTSEAAIRIVLVMTLLPGGRQTRLPLPLIVQVYGHEGKT
jgi:hypothetical protein